MPQRMISPQSELQTGESKYMKSIFVDYLFILECVLSPMENCSLNCIRQ